MKAHRVLLVALVGVLLVSGLAVAQGSGPGVAPAYAVRAGTSSGGGYQVTSLAWTVSGTSAGGEYRLAVDCAPAGGGSGCCCLYLPVVARNLW